ncbi:MAG: protocatechuate 3,4-dioxygenase [Woeseiaceae bacterium]|nr:protocatechuate 3,4-dioxygenase [Woeseiaceae bacterium]
MASRTYTRRQVAQSLGLATGALIASPSLADATATPEQTEGPFYPVVDQADKDIDLTIIDGHTETATGDPILVRGRVLNTAGKPLTDAVVDVWQANHHGRYSHPADNNPAPLDEHFQGWGIMTTDEEGYYGFKTIMPGAYALGRSASSPRRCRHIHYKVSHPDFENITTQMYFEGDPLMEDDIVLKNLSKELWPLLTATADVDEETRLPVYRFDIVLG